MRRLLFVLIFVLFLSVPVHALDLTAPAVPDHAARFMPDSGESFGAGLWEVFRDALMYFNPDLKDACSVCLGLFGVSMLVAIVKTLPGVTVRYMHLAATMAIGAILLEHTGSMISMAADAVAEIHNYGRLLLPVMSAALAAQGGVTSSAAIYAGTVVFNTVLSALITRGIVPLVYLFLAISVGSAATGEDILQRIGGFIKWAVSWCLKTVLYLFTGYISITGVVSGTTDAAVLKATKLTISGMVPVVGGILSDASEAVLVGAGTVKNAAGIYGMYAVYAICIGPFVQIGIPYLLLKCTGALCEIVSGKEVSGLIANFSTAMGFLLAMTGTVTLMLMISLICFMKGMG